MYIRLDVKGWKRVRHVLNFGFWNWRWPGKRWVATSRLEGCVDILVAGTNSDKMMVRISVTNKMMVRTIIFLVLVHVHQLLVTSKQHLI